MSKVYLEHRDAVHVPGAASEAEVAAAVARAAEALVGCDAWIITAGAGMGVDSGMPAFRGTKAIWKDCEIAEHMTYEDMSNDKWFFEDPPFAWGVNYKQMEMYRQTPPHAGYSVLRRLTEELGKPWYIFTSNVDGHFNLSGFEHDRVVTCHGDMHHLQCTRGRECVPSEEHPAVWAAGAIPSGLGDGIDEATLKFRDAAVLEEPYFRCPRCGGLCRPNVWFCSDRRHVYWQDEGDRRQAYIKWLEGLQGAGKKVVVIECGGGMDIPTVRCEGEDAVADAGEGSLLVRLNPTDCRVPAERACGLPLGAREGLERIAAAIAKRASAAPAAKTAAKFAAKTAAAPKGRR